MKKNKQGNDCTKIEPCNHQKSAKPCNHQDTSENDCMAMAPCNKEEGTSTSTNGECMSISPCDKKEDCLSISPCDKKEDCTSISPCDKKEDCASIPPCANKEDCTPIPPCVKDDDCTPIPPCVKDDDCTPIPPCVKETCASIPPCVKETCASIPPCVKETCASIPPCVQETCASIQPCVQESCVPMPPCENTHAHEESGSSSCNEDKKNIPCITEAQCVGKSNSVKEEKITPPMPMVIKEVTCTPMPPVSLEIFRSNVQEKVPDQAYSVTEQPCAFIPPCIKEEKSKSESHKHHHHHHHHHHGDHHGESRRESGSKIDLKKELSSKSESTKNVNGINKDLHQKKSEDANQKSRYIPGLVQKLHPSLRKEKDVAKELKNAESPSVNSTNEAKRNHSNERIENLKKRGVNLSDPNIRKKLIEIKRRSHGDKSNLESKNVKEEPCKPVAV